MSWEERMGAKARAKREALEAAEEARRNAEHEVYLRTVEPWRFDPTPPDDGECRDCYEWRTIPGRDYEGYWWISKCGNTDDYKREDRGECQFGHDHHDFPVWMAGSADVRIDFINDDNPRWRISGPSALPSQMIYLNAKTPT